MPGVRRAFAAAAALALAIPASLFGPLLGAASADTTTTSQTAAPRKGAERIVLQTTAGDIVLALYPDAAPQTARHILALARLGVFDSTYFFRVESNFVAQLDANQRSTPLTDAQKGAMDTVPLEVAAGVRHHRGSLSLAHYDNKPDSGSASFSIVLGDEPHLDGGYTVFGEVESGMDVVDAIAAAPRVGNRPLQRISIDKAVVVDSADALATLHLRGPQPLSNTGSPADTTTGAMRVVVETSMGDLLIALAPKDAPQHVQAFMDLVRAGAYNGATIGRTDPAGGYVQVFGGTGAQTPSPRTTVATEHGGYGNVAGALTIDDAEKTTPPSLTFLLADNHALDNRYTPVGWVDKGSEVLNALSQTKTGADHQPTTPLRINRAYAIDAGAPVVLRGLTSPLTAATTSRGAFGLVGATAFLGLLIALLANRLSSRQIASLGLLVVLLGFFALWVGLAPQAAQSEWLAVGLFGGAIGLFRLMGRFERSS